MMWLNVAKEKKIKYLNVMLNIFYLSIYYTLIHIYNKICINLSYFPSVPPVCVATLLRALYTLAVAPWPSTSCTDHR